MSKILRNGKAVAGVLCAMLLTVTLIAGAITLQKVKNKEIVIPESPSSQPTVTEPPTEEIPWDSVDYTEFFNVPPQMKAMYVSQGADYLTEGRTSAENIKADIDKALAEVKKLEMNTAVFTLVKDGMCISSKTDFPPACAELDILDYAVTAARGQGLYVYVIYDVFTEEQGGKIVDITELSSQKVDQSVTRGLAVASGYDIDGIMLDSFYNVKKPQSYSAYMTSGGGMGFDGYMQQMSESAFKKLCKAVRLGAKSVQIGLLTEPVWANSTADADGSNTSAAFTALHTGNADTKKYAESGYVDFIAVKAKGAIADASMGFKNVVSWWGNLADKIGVPMYAVQYSSKACSDEKGWTEYDQLALQLIASEDMTGFGGSMFDSLSRFQQDLQGSSKAVLDYYSDTLNRKHILTELAVTAPKQKVYTTFEQSVTFMGASDPGAVITINGQKITTDKNGYFTLNLPLVEGPNKFLFLHKGRTDVYTITRQVEVVKEVTPTGNLTVDGGMRITISAIAYKDAKVYATIGGQTIPLTLDETSQDESLRNTSYRLFTGSYVAPASTNSVQNIGNIVVFGEAQGVKKSKEGAYVKVNKKIAIADGVPIRVVSDQAETFPSNVLNDYSDPDYYPIPMGSLDYTVGAEMIYKNSEGKVYSYYKLASGMRVYSADIAAASNADAPNGNAVRSIKVESDSRYTDIILKTEQKVSYSAKYTGSSFILDFNYTNSVPNTTVLADNPMFSKAIGGGTKLELVLNRSGRFLGYRAFYNNSGDLVLRFNNPPGGLAGAKIVVDPGHGGSDVGAMGFLQQYPEKVINRAIAEALVEELRSRGATVVFLETEVNPKMDVRQRVLNARAANPHMFISVHSNSSDQNHSAAGTEVYYFNDFSKSLAAYSSSAIAGAMNTVNRGGKFGRYYVTRDSQFASVLCEVGFLTNETEYKKLISSSYQTQVASAIADAAQQYLKNLGGSSGGGSLSNNGAGGGNNDNNTPEPEKPETSGNAEVTGVELSKTEITLKKGDSITLTAKVLPANAKNKNVQWSSDDKSVAKVNGGKITGVDVGEAVVSVMTVDGEIYEDCYVTVIDQSDAVKVTGVEMPDSKVTLVIGEDYQLYAEVVPPDATDQTLKYSSNNTKVAKVDADGIVIGVSEGKATITATNPSSGKKTACVITVIKE